MKSIFQFLKIIFQTNVEIKFMGSINESCYSNPDISECKIGQLYLMVIVDSILSIFALILMIISIRDLIKYKNSWRWLNIAFWGSNFIFTFYRELTFILPLKKFEKLIIPLCLAIPTILMQLPAIFFSLLLFNYAFRLKFNIPPKLKIFRNVLFILWGLLCFVLILFVSISHSKDSLQRVIFGISASIDLIYLPLVLIPSYICIKISIRSFSHDFGRKCVIGTWILLGLFLFFILGRLIWRWLLVFCKSTSAVYAPFTLPTEHDPSKLKKYLNYVILYRFLAEWAPIILTMIGTAFILKLGQEKASDLQFSTWEEIAA